MSGDKRSLNRCLSQGQYGQMQNRDEKPSTVSNKCDQAARYLHREVAKVEEIVGPIERLTKYEDSWRNDKDAFNHQTTICHDVNHTESSVEVEESL